MFIYSNKRQKATYIIQQVLVEPHFANDDNGCNNLVNDNLYDQKGIFELYLWWCNKKYETAGAPLTYMD